METSEATTITVPTELQTFVYETLIAELTIIVRRQYGEIKDLKAKLPRKPSLGRRFSTEWTKAFPGLMTRKPKFVQETARNIRDTKGHKAAVEYLREWNRTKDQSAGK